MTKHKDQSVISPDVKIKFREIVFKIQSRKNGDDINFRIYQKSTPSMKLGMKKKGEKRGREKYKNLKILKKKLNFFGKIKSIYS